MTSQGFRFQIPAPRSSSEALLFHPPFYPPNPDYSAYRIAKLLRTEQQNYVNNSEQGKQPWQAAHRKCIDEAEEQLPARRQLDERIGKEVAVVERSFASTEGMRINREWSGCMRLEGFIFSSLNDPPKTLRFRAVELASSEDDLKSFAKEELATAAADLKCRKPLAASIDNLLHH